MRAKLRRNRNHPSSFRRAGELRARLRDSAIGETAGASNPSYGEESTSADSPKSTRESVRTARAAEGVGPYDSLSAPCKLRNG
ncbi:MAG: hypothetical protein IJI27_00020 [Oscillospiraceae bacterium]|nr:hypothetical protein [Oscillospiraceae bacterium]